jgi:hypothetical protein
MPALIAKPKPSLLATDRENLAGVRESILRFAIVLEILLPCLRFRVALRKAVLKRMRR